MCVDLHTGRLWGAIALLQMAAVVVQNFIDNLFVDPSSGQWLDNFEPARGAVYGKIARSNADDTEKAVQAAKRAFGRWSKTTPEHRSALLNKATAARSRACGKS